MILVKNCFMKAALATALALTAFGCGDDAMESSDQNSVSLEESPAMKVTDPGVNPFTADNMMKALQNVAGRTSISGRTMADIPSTTHNYVRFAPQNEDQLMDLHDLGYDLYDVPLHLDITSTGEFYQDPSLPSSAITYQYTLVPANYSLPSGIPSTVLSQVFLFNEDAGDEQDAVSDPDPWIPDPPPGSQYCYDEWGQPYVCGTDPRQYLRKNEKLPEDLYIKATVALQRAGINLIELYNQAMINAGLPDEVIDEAPGGRTQDYNPGGSVRVFDNDANIFVPVKHVRVKARRFFKLANTYTNDNGNFYISKKYRKKAALIIKFENSQGVQVRGITGALKVWEYIQLLEKECGMFERSALTNAQLTVDYSTNTNSYAALQWTAAHCLNTSFDMRTYCQARGLPTPQGMNVWISSAITSNASAPMLRAMTGSELVKAVEYMFPGAAATIIKIVRRIVPDVTMRLNGTMRTASNVSETFFHEFAHAQHYFEVGPG